MGREWRGWGGSGRDGREGEGKLTLGPDYCDVSVTTFIEATSLWYCFVFCLRNSLSFFCFARAGACSAASLESSSSALCVCVCVYVCVCVHCGLIARAISL